MFKGYSTVSKIDKKLSIIDKCFNIDKLRKIKKHASPNLNYLMMYKQPIALHY